MIPKTKTLEENESLPNYQVIETITDPKMTKRLGFDIYDINHSPDDNDGIFQDEEILQVMGAEFTDKSPKLNDILGYIVQKARSNYEELSSSKPSLKASVDKWVEAYDQKLGIKDESEVTLVGILKNHGPSKFFSEILPALDLPYYDKVLIAHSIAILDHPGKDFSGGFTGKLVFEQATQYLKSIQNLVPDKLEDFEGDTSTLTSFSDYIDEKVASSLATDALNDIIYLSDSKNEQSLVDRKKHIKEAFDFDLDDYLQAHRLSWEILPLSLSDIEILGGIITDGGDRGWTVNVERVIFILTLARQGGGTIIKSGVLSRSTGYYIAAVMPGVNGHSVVADNPFNTDFQENAIYVVNEGDLNGRTWDMVLSEDKPTARALGAISKRHTNEVKKNVIKTLPSDIRQKLTDIN